MKSLSAKFLFPFSVLTILIFALVFYVTYQASYRHAHQLVHNQLALALEFDLAVRTYAGDKIRPAMEKWVGRDGFIPEAMSTSFISRHIFEEVRKQFPELLIRFPSENPRNPINLATPDELPMIEYFRVNPEVGSRVEEMQLADGRFLVHFAPRWLKPECLRCHGDPRDAPAELVERYGAAAGFHRMVGEMAALDMVAVPVEAAKAALVQDVRSQSIILAAGLLFLFGSILLVFRFTVTRRLKEMAGHFDEIATQAESPAMVPVPVMGSDEISVVGAAFNRLIEQLGAAQASLELRVTQLTEELRNVNDLLQQELGERKRANAALKESEARFRFLVAHMREGLVMSDAAFILEYVNPMMSEISGYRREEMIGRNLGEFLSEEDRGIIVEAQRRRKAGVAERYELNFKGKDGRRVYTQISAHPHYDPQGEFCGAIGVVTDITER